MTWINLIYGFESQLTSSKLQQLRDNMNAALDRDSGAPVLPDDYFKSNQWQFVISTGSTTLSTGQRWTPSSGLYCVSIDRASYNRSTVQLEMYSSIYGWLAENNVTGTGLANNLGMVQFDGTNTRMYWPHGSSVTIYYHKLA